MAESVYKIIELVGTSTDSWEKAAKAAETGCPVSKLFNTKITLEAKLER